MFQIGDEVVCVDDSDRPFTVMGVKYPLRWPLKKGDRFVVQGVFQPGYETSHWYLSCECIGIGVDDVELKALCLQFGLEIGDQLDVWESARFRKVEKKRDRQELYQLLGIDQKLTNKSPEPVDAR